MAVKVVKKKKKKLSMMASKGAVVEQSPYRPYYEEKRPPCTDTCPNGEKVREFLQCIAQHEDYGKTLEEALEEAFYIITETNPIPSTTGRVCPHPCESQCNRKDKDKAVNINACEMYVGDFALSKNLPLKAEPHKEYPHKVAIVGSGPAGLSCAYHLTRLGLNAEIFEREEQPGGLLRYGIPNFRLPKDNIIDREIKRIEDLGVKINCGVEVGKDITLKDLTEKYDAVFLALGAQKAIKPKLDGIDDIEGIYSGMDFLKRYAQGNLPQIGEKVVVIGADTASDAAMICRRLGAAVTFAYRRTIPNEEIFMKTASKEAKQAYEEDIEFQFATVPVELVSEGGKLVGVKFQRIKVEEIDDRGHAKRVTPLDEEPLLVEADTMIYSIGQTPDISHIAKELGITEDGFIKINDQFFLSKERRIFAGGDLVGPKLMYVTTAVGHGKLAAFNIAEVLTGEQFVKTDTKKLITPDGMHLELYDPKERYERTSQDPKERIKNFEPFLNNLSEEEFVEETKRCMSCGLCFDCGNCYTYCSHGCVKKLPKGQHYELHLETCDGCMKCYDNCPCGYISKR